jgi:hypothetical protein
MSKFRLGKIVCSPRPCRDTHAHFGLLLHIANPQLQFVAHLPTSIYGEQLIAQLLRLVPDRGWLFRYGRVPLNLVMHDWVWEVHLCHPYLTLLMSRSVYQQTLTT